MHMYCGWVHGDRTRPKSHRGLRKVYCDERVIQNHGKLQLAMFVVAWEVAKRHDLHRRDASVPFGGGSRRV